MITSDETYFFCPIRGARWSTLFCFAKKDLAGGASLARMMSLHIRETLEKSGRVVPETELREVCRTALKALREEVESFFKSRS